MHIGINAYSLYKNKIDHLNLTTNYQLPDLPPLIQANPPAKCFWGNYCDLLDYNYQAVRFHLPFAFPIIRGTQWRGAPRNVQQAPDTPRPRSRYDASKGGRPRQRSQYEGREGGREGGRCSAPDTSDRPVPPEKTPLEALTEVYSLGIRQIS